MSKTLSLPIASIAPARSQSARTGGWTRASASVHPSRAQLLLDLDQHVGAVGVRQVDGFGIDHNARRRFLLQDELVQSLTEPIGVGKEERAVARAITIPEIGSSPSCRETSW